jgi:hypothetical protein
MAFTTGQTWVDATRNNLMSGFSEQITTLGAPYTAGSGTLTLSLASNGVQPGVRLSVGLNTFYVTAVAGIAISVIGGFEGSVDAAAASGTVLRIAPRFTDHRIWTEIGNDLLDLSSPVNGLYGIAYSDNTYNATYTGYDLGTTASQNLLMGYAVNYLTPGPYRDMPRLSSYAWRVDRNAVTTDIPSGLALRILDPSKLTNGFKVRLTYKSILTLPASLATDAASSGLQTSAYDLPPLGAAIRLMAGREIKRNFTESQGDTRRASEVLQGAVAQSVNGLKQLRMTRIAAEAGRLSQMYPILKD